MIDLEAIEQRAAKATPDWVQAHHVEPKAIVSKLRPPESLLGLDVDGMAILEKEADAEFAAHARQDVPALIAEVRRLRAALAQGVEATKFDGGVDG